MANVFDVHNHEIINIIWYPIVAHWIKINTNGACKDIMGLVVMEELLEVVMKVG